MKFRLLIFFWILLLPFKAWSFKVGLWVDTESPREREALRLAQELATKFRLEGLNYFLADYNPRNPFQALQKAKKEGVEILIGPLNPAFNLQILKASRGSGIPLILLAGDIDPLRITREHFTGVFRTGLSPRLAAKGILRCLAKKGFRKIGLLLSLDQYGRTGLKWLKVYAWEYGLRLSKRVWFGPGDTTLFTKIEELLPLEAVVVWCGKESALKVAREIKRYGLKIPIVFGPEAADEEFLKNHPELYRYPFPGTRLYLSSLRMVSDPPPLSLEISALVDALFLIRHLLAAGIYPSKTALESLKKIKLPGGIYYFSSDDHYGLLPQSVGLFFYDSGGFKPYCAPGSL